VSDGAPVLSTSEVAKRCGVSAKTVARWVDAGVLPAIFTTGGHRRVREDDVERFLDSRRSLLAMDRINPALRIVVVSPHDETVRFVATVAEHYDRECPVHAAADELSAGLIVGDVRPHLIVVDGRDDPQRAGAMCRTLRAADQSRHALVAVVGQRFSGAFEAAHKVLQPPLVSEAVRDVLYDAQAHRS